jgi:hypothetical protein
MVALNSNNLNPEDIPPPHVLAWCENLVRIMADGATWGIPRSGTTFRIDKPNKRLVLVIAGQDDNADFYATKHTFSFIGWDVIKEKNDGRKSM